MVQKIEIGSLEKGFSFPPAVFKIDASAVSAYLKSVEDSTRIFVGSDYVPPMLVTALAMAVMGKQMELPSGSIHVSQEYSFMKAVSTGELLTSRASVARNLERGKIHMLTIEIKIENKKKELVISGETGFILPRL